MNVRAVDYPSRAVILVLVASLVALFTPIANGQQIDSSLVFADSLGNWHLDWMTEETTIHGQTLLFLCFGSYGKYGEYDSFLTIHLKDTSKYTFQPYKELVYKKYSELADAMFMEPRLFSNTPRGDSVPSQFILIRDQEMGTGNYNIETLLRIDKEGKVEAVP